jgi:hypothetical protein
MDQSARGAADNIERRASDEEERFEKMMDIRFNEMEKRISTADKRLDDVKRFVSGIT